jgi:AraC-like DNA-binding protein
MFYRKIIPASPLQTLVECYYIWECNELMGEPITIESPPSGFTSIVFNYGDCYKTSSTDNSDFKTAPRNFIAGQATKTYKLLLEGRIGMIGIVFRPAAINTLFGIPMYELNDERLDLNSVLGKEILPVQERIMEAQTNQEKIEIIDRFLLFKLLNCKAQPNQVDFASNLIVSQNGIINISKMMEELCVCRRQLERQFLQKVGVSPKYYARIRRVSYLCFVMANKRWQVADWHDLIYQMGYYDQSHFIKEFTAFTGKSPSFYLKNNLELSNYLQS